MAVQISDPSIVINNVAVAIVPNSVEFDEGFGEQDVLVQSAGGGSLQQVYANNVETNLGMVKFQMRSTTQNIELVRGWKANGNRNVVVITAKTDDGTLARSYTQAAITNNYTVKLAADGVIDVEFKANKPTI